ncbi:uncharacterized protein [Diabrotica undecimpunctata]|uniref:uncharacterized protein n=1 Tax=Diabrotica undecimpunctata TaxID=50387 RepID=UPI003B641A9D
MKFLRSTVYYIAILAILFSLCADEVEGRRKILMGRKSITRTYLRGNAVPAYVIIILVGIGQIILGGILYVALRKKIIQAPITGSYAVARQDP